MQSELEAQIGILKILIKQVETRIKEVQQETKESFTQEDAWIKQGVEHELIHWKIKLEKWKKLLKKGLESVELEG